MRRAVGLAIVLAAFAAPPARAQTSDIVFGGWSWRSRDAGSRPAGLGGAYVAVADSIRTAGINPAGIALIPKAELAAGTANLWAGIGYSLGHAITPAKPAGPAAPAGPVAGRPTQPAVPAVPCAPARQTRPFAIALFGERAATQENQVDVVRGPERSESGSLSSSAEEVGLSLARGADGGHPALVDRALLGIRTRFSEELGDEEREDGEPDRDSTEDEDRHVGRHDP